MSEKIDRSKWERKDNWLLSLILKLFWLFFLVTLVFIFYTIFVPNATDWNAVAGTNKEFPNNFNASNLFNAVVRHLALWGEHVNGSFLISVINLVFLTMFVRSIGIEIERSMGSDGKGTVKMHVYVEWAMVSLISGILFFSSNVAGSSPLDAIVYMGVIVVFAVVSTYILYHLRKELKKEKEQDKTEPEIVSSQQQKTN